jgi:hypothetical protein
MWYFCDIYVANWHNAAPHYPRFSVYNRFVNCTIIDQELHNYCSRFSHRVLNSSAVRQTSSPIERGLADVCIWRRQYRFGIRPSIRPVGLRSTTGLPSCQQVLWVRIRYGPRPRTKPRLVYLSSGMHYGAGSHLDDMLWEKRRWNGSYYSRSRLRVFFPK